MSIRGRVRYLGLEQQVIEALTRRKHFGAGPRRSLHRFRRAREHAILVQDSIRKREGYESRRVDAILYLESANFVTGEILHVDGDRALATDVKPASSHSPAEQKIDLAMWRV